jgi:hypothetical protein
MDRDGHALGPAPLALGDFDAEVEVVPAPWWFLFDICARFFRLSRLRSLSTAASSAGSVMGLAMTRCKGAILGGKGALLDIAHSSYEYTWKVAKNFT